MFSIVNIVFFVKLINTVKKGKRKMYHYYDLHHHHHYIIFKFKKLRNTVNNEIKRAKECYYKHAFSESQGDSRNTWRIFNELMPPCSNRVNVQI